jgi:cytosine/adenosine deaminase-related metal-dependent hydrolase
MKKFAAQYIITGTGDVLKRGVVSCDDSGMIVSVSDTSGELKEAAAIPFYNGIIVPGFINCHTHLELSDMKGVVERGQGLGRFIADIREKRNPSEDMARRAIIQSDRDLYRSGTAAVADICNTRLTFDTKDKSKIDYINLLEIFGIDPGKAGKRMDEIIALKKEADDHKSPSFIVPHSVYSISQPLFNMIREVIDDNLVTSIHFLESMQERELINKLEGELLHSYNRMGIDKDILSQRAQDHLQVVRDYLPASGKLILVHNTFADSDIIRAVQERGDVSWCLCPNANLYIENSLPPLEELRESSATIVLGTDSLASNDSLNLLEEIKTLQHYYPAIDLPEMVEWATINGAETLNLSDRLGTIEEGKAPGLVLLENCDLVNLRLKADTSSTRLI